MFSHYQASTLKFLACFSNCVQLFCTMSLQLFYDRLSQPSRAVEIFLKATGIPYIPEYRSIMERAHMTEDFYKINKFRKLPAIVHNGKNLSESTAIMCYLAQEYNVPDHWYPKENYKRAKVDEYLAYHHLGTRIYCYRLVWAKALFPMMGKKLSADNQIKMEKELSKACDSLCLWLEDKPFLAGNEISIADLLASTELDQLVLTGFDPRIGRPTIASWLERVRKATNPHYDDVSSDLFEFKSLVDSTLSAKL